MAIEHFHRTEEPEGHLKIGVMDTLCSSEYTDLFYTFQEKYPKITMYLEIVTTLQAMEDLDKGKFDLIFLLDKKITRPNWVTSKEFPAEIAFFCSSRHSLAGASAVSLDRLLQERFILTEQSCNYRDVFENDLASAGKRLNCAMEIGHTDFIINAVSRQLGIGLLPLFTLKEALAKGDIALIRVKDYQIRQDTRLIAMRSVETLLACLGGEAKPVREMVPFQLLKRESVRALSPEDRAGSAPAADGGDDASNAVAATVGVSAGRAPETAKAGRTRARASRVQVSERRGVI